MTLTQNMTLTVTPIVTMILTVTMILILSMTVTVPMVLTVTKVDPLFLRSFFYFLPAAAGGIILNLFIW